jgi:outer membrane protein
MFKKVVLMVAVAWSAAVFTGKAQMFVGGSFGLDVASNKLKGSGESADVGKSFGFDLTPKFGYYLNDKLAVGGQIGFGITSSTPPAYAYLRSLGELGELLAEDFGDGFDADVKGVTTTFTIAAFGRYHLFDVDKLSLIMEGSLGFTASKLKMTAGGVTTEEEPLNTVGLSVMPVLAYNLTDRFGIEASSDFLRFGFSSSSQKWGDAKSVNTSFGFGANSTTGLIQLGVVYKF